MENVQVPHNRSFFDINGNSSEVADESSMLLFDFIVKATVCGIGTILNSLVIAVIVYGSLMRTSVFMILLVVLAVFDNLSLWFVLLRSNVLYNLLPLSSSLWLCHTIIFSMNLTERVETQV